MNLTIDVLKEAVATLPARLTDVVAVRWGNGRMAMEMPIDRIVPSVLSGWIEWDEGCSAFYLTIRAEHELHARGLE